jgi:hypothetical protein
MELQMERFFSKPESKHANPEYKLPQELHFFEPAKIAYFPTEQILQTEEPLVDEYCPPEQLRHCDAPLNIVCVEVKRVCISIGESTLLYMRKSLMPPFM